MAGAVLSPSASEGPFRPPRLPKALPSRCLVDDAQRAVAARAGELVGDGPGHQVSIVTLEHRKTGAHDLGDGLGRDAGEQQMADAAVSEAVEGTPLGFSSSLPEGRSFPCIPDPYFPCPVDDCPRR